MTETRQFCPRGHDTFIVGRDSSHRCLACKRIGMRDAYRRRVEEEAAEQAEIRRTELLRQREEHQRRKEREFQAAMQAGGGRAIEAKWQRLWSESLRAKGHHGLCQWTEDIDGVEAHACTGRADGGMVYCAKHNRQVEREAAQQRNLP